MKHIHINDLAKTDINTLIKTYDKINLSNKNAINKEEIMYEILITYDDHNITVEGILDLVKGYGFLRLMENSFKNNLNDVYVNPLLIKRYALKQGYVIKASVEKKSGKFNISEILEINFKRFPQKTYDIKFESLTPIFPDKQIILEFDDNHLQYNNFYPNYANRSIDLFSPIGYGQRGLIVASPKSGKTYLLQSILYGLIEHKEIETFVLLIEERPEEATHFIHNFQEKANIIHSTFDESPLVQTKISCLTIEYLKRKVENNQNVVLLIDSLTRLTRAFNNNTDSGNKMLSGGLDPQALQNAKKIFGTARNIQNGGSLTILATCLINTDSKLDEVVALEFKGTGNTEIFLDQSLAIANEYPAIDILKSSTRNFHLLQDKEYLNPINVLKSAAVAMEKNGLRGISFMKARYKKYLNNKTLLKSLIENKE